MNLETQKSLKKLAKTRLKTRFKAEGIMRMLGFVSPDGKFYECEYISIIYL